MTLQATPRLEDGRHAGLGDASAMATSDGVARQLPLIDAGAHPVDALPERAYRQAHLPDAIAGRRAHLSARRERSLTTGICAVVVGCSDAM